MNFVDRQYIIDALCAVEAEVDGYGWDKPPVVALLCKTPDDKPGFAVIPNRFINKFAPADAPEDAGAALYRLGQYLMQPGHAKAARNLIAGTQKLIGIVCCNEAWMSLTPPNERSGKRIADLPANLRTELRMVNALDLQARSYYFWRERGKQLRNAAEEDGLTDITGRVPEAMRLILLACARQMPGFELSALKLARMDFIKTGGHSFR